MFALSLGGLMRTRHLAVWVLLASQARLPSSWRTTSFYKCSCASGESVGVSWYHHFVKPLAVGRHQAAILSPPRSPNAHPLGGALPRYSLPPTMARAATLVGFMLVGDASEASTFAAIPTGGVAAGGDLHDALRAATRDLQVMLLQSDCGAECQADTMSRLTAAGCDQVRLFPTLRMASARCAARSGGGGGWDAADWDREVDLSRLPGVHSVAPDGVVTMDSPDRGSAGDIAAADGGAVVRAMHRGAWGLDRINQAALPLDGNTSTPCYLARGAEVTVYVIDTGLTTEHEQFGGRALALEAPDADLPSPADEYSNGMGHGSHVAGTVAGETTGVTPAATIVGIRAFDARGASRRVDVVSAIEYVTAAKAARRGATVVLNASSSADNPDGTTTAAADRAAEAGVIAVVSAGNEPISACTYHPARATGAITVAATLAADEFALFSARGRCVAVSAPGVHLSVRANTTDGLIYKTGTSMAAPHVSGLTALIMAEDRKGGDLGRDEKLRRLTRGAPTAGGFPMAWANPSCA